MDISEITERKVVQEANCFAITSRFKDLFTSHTSIEPGDLLEKTIHLDRGDARLTYIRQPLLFPRVPLTITAAVTDMKRRKLATNDIVFWDEGQNIAVDMNLSVEQECQSKGLGTGLAFSGLIEDAIIRYPELRGRTVMGRIVDSASGWTDRNGRFVKRHGWSSNLLRQAGYVRDAYGVWKKVYQYASKKTA